MTVRLLHLAQICFALLLAASSISSYAQSANNVYTRASRSVGIVIVSTFEGQLVGSGSAVTVASQTMVTNRHVLLPGHRYQIYINGGIYEAYMTMCDSTQDLCLLEVRNLEAKAVEFGDANKLNVGDIVYTVGAPNEIGNIVGVSTATKQKSFSAPQLTLSNGLITALRPLEDGNLIQTNAAISPGSSGGGLFDANGRLIGITTFMMKSGQSLNMALPVNWVERLGVTGAPRNAEVVATAVPAAPSYRPTPVIEQQEENEAPAVVEAPVPAPTPAVANGNSLYWWLLIPAALILFFVMRRRRSSNDDSYNDSARPAAAIDPMRQRCMDEATQELEQNRPELMLWNIIIADHKGNVEAARESYIKRRTAKLLSIEKDKQWTATAQSQTT